MANIDDQGRPEAPANADETATLLGFLDFQRATLEWKCAGLDASGMNARVGMSSMTLGGILKHMALVENSWFTRSLHAGEYGAPFDTIDWSVQPDWDWESAVDNSPDELRQIWRDSVSESRRQVERALHSGGLDQLSKRAWADGTSPSLRWILCHMIEEYARHNGHADLLREFVDGETGE